MSESQLVHCTTIAFEKEGWLTAVLLRGKSGSGKSDLALRVIDSGRAELVSDDQTLLTKHGNDILASPPSTIAGKLEVRGLGIVSFSYCSEVPVGLIVDLVPREGVDRLPESTKAEILGVEIPCVQLYSFDHSTVAKLLLAISRPESDIVR
ncbi:HPr kinase/phosphorylase [Kiloniella sp. EL199]|uniref:HPr kinase/phosphorylase n=1 Tax=Kiloniella sp. EL199 TaxID=2107581 RepID=UPI000EA0F223|nr:HPr kinase/phosphatase C-terminal domain-containing protein [Kiloniella sp. EL199]